MMFFSSSQAFCFLYDILPLFKITQTFKLVILLLLLFGVTFNLFYFMYSSFHKTLPLYTGFCCGVSC